MERRLRWITGLTLFAFATCHFLSHATGLFGLHAVDAIGRRIILAPWQTFPGHVAVFGSLAIHAGLGLIALYRRRHLRIPAQEAWQLGTGLLIPLLILPHAVNVRVGSAAYGLEESYYRIIYQYWVSSPGIGLARQIALLALVWVHGCLGLHFRLKLRPFYGRARPWLASIAILIPFLAVMGLMNAGWDARLHTLTEPDFSAKHGPPLAGTAGAANLLVLRAIWEWAQIAWIGIVATILLLRVLRDARLRRRPLRLVYPGNRVVTVPVGFSVLEASRWAGIPHASICGGRGRCSTCRVRVGVGRESLPDSKPAERATLDRIGAPEGVRLACQLRPTGELSVAPLLPWDIKGTAPRFAPDMVREVRATALFIDLRGSTRLAADRLPFDTLYIIDSYVQCVTAAVRAQGGFVTSVAGDGLMCVFGLGLDSRGPDALAGAPEALAAAFGIWEALDRLSGELAHELSEPLGFGIGLHAGLVAAGTVTQGAAPTMVFFGDTGNVAARLESMTKELRCRLIVSQTVLDAAGIADHELETVELALRGREVPVPCVTIATVAQGRRLSEAALA